MAAIKETHEFRFLISEPTYCRLKHSMNPKLAVKLHKLQNIMAVSANIQRQQEKMMSEGKLLKIMIYKRNRQLRREKSLQLLKRVQACLKRASAFGRLFTLIDDVHKDVLSAVAEMKKSETVYLPAQQTWSYLLYLQLQFVKLLGTSSSYCIIAFKHLSCQLATGMLIPQMIVFMGIVARIWLLSRSITEKLQSCYGPIYSVRKHIDRTNSTWEDPVLPLQLELSDYDKIRADVKEMFHTAAKVPISDSMETIQGDHMDVAEQQEIEIPRNNLFVLDEHMEDIGVPVVITRTVGHVSSDNTSNKRQKIGLGDFKTRQQRKSMKKRSVKHDTVTEVSGDTSTDLTMAAGKPAKKVKKRKRKLEERVSSDMQPIKKKRYSADHVRNVTEVQSLTATNKHDTENVHSHEMPSLVQNVKDCNFRQKKKHKKKKTKTISNIHTFKENNVDASSNIPSDSNKTNLKVPSQKKHQKTKEKHRTNSKQVYRVESADTKFPRNEVDRTKAKLKKKKKMKHVRTS